MTHLDALLTEIRACRLCEAVLPLGPRPVLRASSTARILIVGQAPGRRVHETGIPWNDPSGDQLRQWLGMTRDEFYRAYSELTGLEIDDESLRFWEVLGNVKLAAIFLTGGRSFCEGRSKDAIHAFTAYLNPDIEVEILRLID